MTRRTAVSSLLALLAVTAPAWAEDAPEKWADPGLPVTDGLQLWPEAEMSALSMPELLSIRKNQVLRKALTLCQIPRRHQARAAFEIVAQNLILHDYPDIAGKLTEAGAARADCDAQMPSEARTPCRPSW